MITKTLSEEDDMDIPADCQKKAQKKGLELKDPDHDAKLFAYPQQMQSCEVSEYMGDPVIFDGDPAWIFYLDVDPDAMYGHKGYILVIREGMIITIMKIQMVPHHQSIVYKFVETLS
ncbi:MAG: hypothetical protein ABH832_03530 [bacterium]